MKAPRKVRPATRWLFGRVLEMHAKLDPKVGGEVSAFPGTERIAALMGCSRATVVNLIAAIRADDKETIRVRYQARQPDSVRRLPNVYAWTQERRPAWYIDGLRRLLALYQAMPESIGSTPRAVLASIALGRGFRQYYWIGKELGLDPSNVKKAVRTLQIFGVLRVASRRWDAGTGKGGQLACNTYEIDWRDGGGWRDASPHEKPLRSPFEAPSACPGGETDQDLAKPQDECHAASRSVTACDQGAKTTSTMGRKHDRPGGETDQDLAAEISLSELAALPAGKPARLTIRTKRSKRIEAIRAMLRVANPKLDTEQVAGRLLGMALNLHDGTVLEVILPTIAVAWVAAHEYEHELEADAIAEYLVAGDVFGEHPLWATVGRLLDEGHRDAPALLSQLCAACYDKSRWPEVRTRIMAAAA